MENVSVTTTIYNDKVVLKIYTIDKKYALKKTIVIDENLDVKVYNEQEKK